MIQAIELDPAFSKKIGQIVLLGGAFAVNGNVNPAAEANVSSSNLNFGFHYKPKMYVAISFSLSIQSINIGTEVYKIVPLLHSLLLLLLG